MTPPPRLVSTTGLPASLLLAALLFAQGVAVVSTIRDVEVMDLDTGDTEFFEDVPVGGSTVMDPAGVEPTKMSFMVGNVVKKECPRKHQEVIVRAVGPCQSTVQSGTSLTCVLSFIKGATSAMHVVAMVDQAMGGKSFYFRHRKPSQKELFCETLMVSSFELGEGASFLQNFSSNGSATVKRKVQTSSFMTKVVLTDYGPTAARPWWKRIFRSLQSRLPSWFRNTTKVVRKAAEQEYEHGAKGAPSASTLPLDFSVLTDFTSRKGSARSSAECFPGGGVAGKPGGTIVSNQGDCGSCWAHAASSAASDRMCLAGVAGMEGHGKDRSLSIQQVLSCSEESIDRPCDGGFMANYFDFGVKHGLAKREDSPYCMKCPKKATDDPSMVVSPRELGIDCAAFGRESADAPGLSEFPCVCMDPRAQPERQPTCHEAMRRVGEVYKLEAVLRMPFEGMRISGKTYSLSEVVTFYQEELYTNGPFTVGVQVFSDFNSHYKQRKVYIKNPQAQARGGHALVLTGWGTHMQLPYPWECAAPPSWEDAYPQPSRPWPPPWQPSNGGGGWEPQPPVQPVDGGGWRPPSDGGGGWPSNGGGGWQPQPPPLQPFDSGGGGWHPQPDFGLPSHRGGWQQPSGSGGGWPSSSGGEWQPQPPRLQPFDSGVGGWQPQPDFGLPSHHGGWQQPSHSGGGWPSNGGGAWQPSYGTGGIFLEDDSAVDASAKVGLADCNIAREVMYWEVRNSWGTGWGDNGYTYVRRGVNEVDIETVASVPVVDKSRAGPWRPK